MNEITLKRIEDKIDLHQQMHNNHVRATTSSSDTAQRSLNNITQTVLPRMETMIQAIKDKVRALN